MYKKPYYRTSSIRREAEEVGQTLETKIRQVLENNESLEEKPIIYTEKKDGVQAGYNIRTDKWEIAVETMDKINKVRHAKSESRKLEGKVIEKGSEGIEPTEV